MHVLIIEDEALIAVDIRCFLEELGADTADFAETEVEAIRSAIDRPPDLITADVSLREGSGVDAVASIRAHIGNVPVVYVTGQPQDVPCLDANTHVVAKPVLWLELASALAEHDIPPTRH